MRRRTHLLLHSFMLSRIVVQNYVVSYYSGYYTFAVGRQHPKASGKCPQQRFVLWLRLVI